MATFSTKISNLINKMNSTKGLSTISGYKAASQEIDSTISLMSAASSNLGVGLTTFFTDLGLGANGEGINLMKGNSFSDSIPEEFVYKQIRAYIWENLEHYSNSDKSISTLENRVNTFVNKCNEIENGYDDFLDSYEPPETSGGGSSEGGEGESPPSPMEIYWGQVFSGFQLSLNSVNSAAGTISSSASGITGAINNWINLGLEASINISKAQNIYGFKKIDINGTDLYTIFEQKTDYVSLYASGYASMFRKVKIIVDNFPEDRPITELNNEIRDTILRDLNIASRSQSILNQIKGYFGNL